MNRLLFGFVPVYGLLISLAIAMALFLCSREEKRLGLPRDTVVDLALRLVPAGVVGARLYYVAFRWDLYSQNLLQILKIWEGGLAIYGGVIGGALAVFFFARKRKLSFALLADMIAPAMILAQAIGRWGNFFNGEAYGNPVMNPAWQFFPVAVYADGAWHLATFFYESCWDFLGFLLLWLLRKRPKVPGSLFLMYLCWYGLGRMVIEGLRMDSLMLGPVRVSQALSALLALSAGIALAVRRKRAKADA